MKGHGQEYMIKNTNWDIPKNAVCKYSLHTFTIRTKLPGGSNDLIRIDLDKLSEDKYPQKAHKIERNTSCIYYFDIARHYGFNEVKIIKVFAKKLTHPKYYLDIKINPWRLFHNDTYPFLYIASKDDLINSLKLIETLLADIELPETLIKNFYLKRVDFCTNICLSSCDAVNEYMKLLHQGSYPYKFNRLQEYSNSQRKWIATKNSFTVNSKHIQFSLYNKYKQLKEEANKYSLDEIEEAKGIIRIELRIERSVINRKEKKYDLEDAYAFLGFASQMANEDIPRYLKMTYGSGNFVTYKRAKEIIENAHYRESTKDLLLQMLSAVKETRSLQSVKKALGKKDYSKCMRLFNKLEISPITINKRANSKAFFHPLFYIETANCNQPALEI